MLHTDADLSIAVEGAIEAHNIGRVAFMQDLQFSDNLVSDGRFDFQVDQLTRKKQKNKQKQNTETKYCFNLSCMQTMQLHRLKSSFYTCGTLLGTPARLLIKTQIANQHQTAATLCI